MKISGSTPSIRNKPPVADQALSQKQTDFVAHQLTELVNLIEKNQFQD